MTPKILAVSTAALLIAAGSAQAAAGGRYAEPKQPIAYSQLNAYLKASPKQRATRDFTLTADNLPIIERICRSVGELGSMLMPCPKRSRSSGRANAIFAN